MSPNNTFQPMPLRVPKIVPILQRGRHSFALSFYHGGTAECWPFGQQLLGGGI